jgi:hypothetical protein
MNSPSVSTPLTTSSSIDTSIADLVDRDATVSYDDDFEEDLSL